MTVAQGERGREAAGRVFVSYRRSRKAEVLVVVAWLRSAGVDVWLDTDDIDPLADFPERIRAGIDGSHAMLVWWSLDYAESAVCLQELRRAWQHARRHSSDVGRRVWVLNPESGASHVFAGELDASNFLQPPPVGSEAAWAAALRDRLLALVPEGPLATERRAERVPPIHGAPLPSRDFTGRGAELMRLHSALFPARVGPDVRGAAVQIHGLGGLGKSELAAAYVGDFALAYPAGVLWLNLAPWIPAHPVTREDAAAAWLRALGAALSGSPTLWSALAIGPDGKTRPAPEVRERLAGHFGDHEPWLVVLDNLPELSPLDARQGVFLEVLAAPGSHGRTLITTRDARPIEGCMDLGLGPLVRDDALRLLARFRPNHPAERKAMEALLDDVGSHTQSLVLLGERYREGPSGYAGALVTLRDQGLLARLEAIAAQLRDELGLKARGIVAALATSIDPLSEPARRLLALASHCTPNVPIPDGLLGLAYGGQSMEDEFVQALRATLRTSLLDRRDRADSVYVHPLVAQAARVLLDVDFAALLQSLEIAVVQRMSVLRADPGLVWSLSDDAVHARYLAARAAGRNAVLLHVGLAFLERIAGDLVSARAHGEAAVSLARKTLEAEDPDTVDAMNTMAAVLLETGDYAQAAELSVAALEVSQRLWGSADGLTLSAKSNLAYAARKTRDFATAYRLQEEVLSGRLNTSGKGDRDTLAAMNNLAGTLREQAAVFRGIAHDLESPGNHLGAGRAIDPDAGAASELRDQAQLALARARDVEQRALEVRRRVQGPEHPETLIAMDQLAQTLLDLGEAAAAAELQRSALEATHRLKGPRHPDTTACAWNLLVTLGSLGEQSHAEIKQVFKRDLSWLLEADPAALGANQGAIRSQLRQSLGRTGAGKPAAQGPGSAPTAS